MMKNKFSIIIFAYILFFVAIVVVGYNIVNKRNQDIEIKVESQSEVQSEIESMSLLSSSERELEDWEKEAIKEQEEYEKWLKDMNEKYDFEYARGGNGWLVVCYELAKKNGDWSRIPLTENFKKKYNEKDGILGDITYDKIEYMPYSGTDSDFTFKEYYTYFVIYQGKKQVAYFFDLYYDNNGWIDDVKFYDIIETYDENGKKFEEEKVGIDSNTWTYCFYNLAHGGDAERQVGVTEKFHKKYLYFFSIFEHYSPYMTIEFEEEKSSFDKMDLYFKTDCSLECKNKEYKVKFLLDSNGFLDEVYVEKIGEEKYKGGSQQLIAKLVYKNSCWDDLEITKQFRKKFNNTDGVMKNIDIVNPDYYLDSASLISEKKLLLCYTDIKGMRKSCLFEYLNNKDGLIDDIKITKLDYVNMSAKEIKKKYFSEYE